MRIIPLRLRDRSLSAIVGHAILALSQGHARLPRLAAEKPAAPVVAGPLGPGISVELDAGPTNEPPRAAASAFFPKRPLSSLYSRYRKRRPDDPAIRLGFLTIVLGHADPEVGDLHSDLSMPVGVLPVAVGCKRDAGGG